MKNLTALPAAILALASSWAGYTPPTGYTTIDLGLTGSAIAISANGRLAVAQDSFSGGATVSLYNQVGLGRVLLGTISAPAGDTWKFISALSFDGNDHLIIAESGDMDTVYDATLGGATRLAPVGSVNNISGVAFGFGGLYALASNNPGQGEVFKIAGGTATSFATGLGVGYTSGLAFHGSHLYVGDTNDPFFMGNPGQVIELDSLGATTDLISLAGGGQGLFDVLFDSEGDMICSTGSTLTANGATFGSFDGPFPFPTFLAYHGNRFQPFDGDGMLLVNGTFTSAGSILAVTPVPEPSVLILGAGFLGRAALRRRRKNGRGGARPSTGLTPSLTLPRKEGRGFVKPADPLAEAVIVTVNTLQTFPSPACGGGLGRGCIRSKQLSKAQNDFPFLACGADTERIQR